MEKLYPKSLNRTVRKYNIIMYNVNHISTDPKTFLKRFCKFERESPFVCIGYAISAVFLILVVEHFFLFTSRNVSIVPFDHSEYTM